MCLDHLNFLWFSISQHSSLSRMPIRVYKILPGGGECHYTVYKYNKQENGTRRTACLCNEMTANLHSLHRPEISSQEQGCYASSVQRKRSRQTSFEQQWCNFHQAVEYESRYLLHYCIPGSGSASHIALTNINATRESGLPPQLVSSDCRHPFRWKLLFACHKI